LPASSNLKRGSIDSRSVAAASAARERAAVARRAAAVLRAVVDGFFAAVVVFFVVVAVFRVVVVWPAAALACIGSPMAVAKNRTLISLAAAENRVRITGKPL
jgi:hypothetical protein